VSASAGTGPGPRGLLVLAAAVAFAAAALAVVPQVSSTGDAWVRSDLHTPRALLGALAGASLAACGVVLQAVLRNPLASPYTLGIASGAAVGATAVIQLGLGAGVAFTLLGHRLTLAVPATYLGALAGALLTAGFVYAVARRRELAAETLLLTGVAVALFSGAVTSVFYFLADALDLVAMVRWSMGSLVVVGYEKVALAAPFVVVGAGLVASVSRHLSVASLDDDSARGLGVDPVRIRRLAFVGTSLVVAGVVAVTGPIGFVGLIVPHAARRLVGPDPRLLLPTAAGLGAGFLVVADLAARTLFYPTELPINVITHAIGCPLFVWILVRRR